MSNFDEVFSNSWEVKYVVFDKRLQDPKYFKSLHGALDFYYANDREAIDQVVYLLTLKEQLDE